MVKRATLLLLGLSMVTFIGCASSSSKSPSARVATPADVNGTWTGGTTTGAGRTVTMILKQTGTNVEGTLSGAGTLDGPITGMVDGNTIRLAQRSGFKETPLLNVEGDQISGIVG